MFNRENGKIFHNIIYTEEDDSRSEWWLTTICIQQGQFLSRKVEKIIKGVKYFLRQFNATSENLVY